LAGATGFEPATTYTPTLSRSLDTVSQPGMNSQYTEAIQDSAHANSDPMAPASTKTKKFGEPVVNGLVNVERLLTVREVAKNLRVCRATVYKLAEQGLLAHVRINNSIRVLPNDVAAFMERGRKFGERSRGEKAGSRGSAVTPGNKPPHL